MDSNNSKQDVNVVKLPHHDPVGPCLTRALYRQGKKLTAVKVYTVNDESQHLIVRDVPAIKLQNEVKNLCLRYGEIKSFHIVTNYAEDEEPFTEVYHVLYNRIQSARFAKHMLDNKSFFGGVLKVCYAPELESASETRLKLKQRRRDIAVRVNKLQQQSENKTEQRTEDSEVTITSVSHNEAIDTIKPSPVLLKKSQDDYALSTVNSWAEGGLLSSCFIPYNENERILQSARGSKYNMKKRKRSP